MIAKWYLYIRYRIYPIYSLYVIKYHSISRELSLSYKRGKVFGYLENITMKLYNICVLNK